MTDSWETKRTFSRPCTVIDRKGGSSILLSMTALSEEFIHIKPFSKKWWFNVQTHQLLILSPCQFIKAYRNQACVYAAIKAPEELFLPNEDDNAVKIFSSLPKEFVDFQDYLFTAQTILLLAEDSPEHAIDLLPSTTPPYRLIYSLS